MKYFIGLIGLIGCILAFSASGNSDVASHATASLGTGLVLIAVLVPASLIGLKKLFDIE